MRAKFRRGIDLLVLPYPDWSVRLEDDRVLHHEDVALLIADLALVGLGAPDVLDRVPFESALPVDVDAGDGIAEARLAFVAALGHHLRPPSPAQPLHLLPQRLRHGRAQRHRLQRGTVDRPDEGLLGVLDDLVVADRPGIALHHLEGAHRDRGFLWPRLFACGPRGEENRDDDEEGAAHAEVAAYRLGQFAPVFPGMQETWLRPRQRVEGGAPWSFPRQSCAA